MSAGVVELSGPRPPPGALPAARIDTLVDLGEVGVIPASITPTCPRSTGRRGCAPGRGRRSRRSGRAAHKDAAESSTTPADTTRSGRCACRRRARVAPGGGEFQLRRRRPPAGIPPSCPFVADLSAASSSVRGGRRRHVGPESARSAEARVLRRRRSGVGGRAPAERVPASRNAAPTEVSGVRRVRRADAVARASPGRRSAGRAGPSVSARARVRGRPAVREDAGPARAGVRDRAPGRPWESIADARVSGVSESVDLLGHHTKGERCGQGARWWAPSGGGGPAAGWAAGPVASQGTISTRASATSAGRSSSSISTVCSIVSRTPLSEERTPVRRILSRTRAPTLTGCRKRTLFSP